LSNTTAPKHYRSFAMSEFLNIVLLLVALTALSLPPLQLGGK
jgi:hypothetical protein